MLRSDGEGRESGVTMYAEERQQAIARLVNQRGRMSVNQLAREYDVTTETVRRDLSTLERMGLVRRVHGGVVPPSSLSLIEAGLRVRPDLAADWGRIVDEWRRAYQPAMDEVVRSARPWRDLDDIQAQTLDTVLNTLAVTLSGEHREELVQSWRRLPPWPDVSDGLATLRALCITATLSNGHVALLVDLLRYAGLQVDATLSAQYCGLSAARESAGCAP